MSGSNNEIANTGGPASAAEPSMEEILASIRRILKDDQTSQPDGGDADEDVLVLDSSMVVKPGTAPHREVESPGALGPLPEEPQEPIASEPIIEAPFHEEAALEPALIAPTYEDAPYQSFEMSSPEPYSPAPDLDLSPTATEATFDNSEPHSASYETHAEAAAATYAREEQDMSDNAQENLPPHGLVGEAASSAAAGSIGALIRTISSDRQVAVGRAGLTLEDLVREELRPLLKSWLDSNLPTLVERIVRSEIQRVIERTEI